MQSTLFDVLDLSAWIAWNDAELADTLPVTSAMRATSGDRLPYSGRHSGSLRLERALTLWTGATGGLAGTVSYVDERKGQFRSADVERATFPPFVQVDLQGRLQHGQWTVTAFVNNATDRRGVLRSGSDFDLPDLITYIQPRTIGMQLEYAF